MTFQKTYVFACFWVPNPPNSIESCAQNEIILSIELDSINCPLMTPQSKLTSRRVNIIDPDCWISRPCNQLFASQAEINIKNISISLFKSIDWFSWSNIPNGAGSITWASCTYLPSVLYTTAIDLPIMTFKFRYLLPCPKIPNDCCFIKRTCNGLITMVIMLDTNHFTFMFLQLINAFTILNVPNSSGTVKRRCAQVGTIWIELHWGYFCSVPTQGLKHLPWNIPKSCCFIERTSCDEISIWKMTEVQTKYSISVTRQSTYQTACLRIPYLASSIITRSSKILPILAESAVSQRLLMSFQLQLFFVIPFLRLISLTNL